MYNGVELGSEHTRAEHTAPHNQVVEMLSNGSKQAGEGARGAYLCVVQGKSASSCSRQPHLISSTGVLIISVQNIDILVSLLRVWLLLGRKASEAHVCHTCERNGSNVALACSADVATLHVG